MWDNYEKVEPRRRAFVGVPKNVRTALFLPAASAYCVEEALRLGVIGSRTRIVCVENDLSKAKAIRNKIGSLGLLPQTDLYFGHLHSLKLNGYLDYAFFDLCGQITYPLMKWFESNSQRINQFAITLQTHPIRNNKLLQNSHIKDLAVYKKAKQWFEELDVDYNIPLRGLGKKGWYLPHVENDYVTNLIYLQAAFWRRRLVDDLSKPIIYRGQKCLLMSVSAFGLADWHDQGDQEVFHDLWTAIDRRDFLSKSKLPQTQEAGIVTPALTEEKEMSKTKTQIKKVVEKYPANYTPAQKRRATRDLANGIRPEYMSPQTWAWHPKNPNGMAHRRKVAS